MATQEDDRIGEYEAYESLRLMFAEQRRLQGLVAELMGSQHSPESYDQALDAMGRQSVRLIDYVRRIMNQPYRDAATAFDQEAASLIANGPR